jgi:hypothetical protein
MSSPVLTPSESLPVGELSIPVPGLLVPPEADAVGVAPGEADAVPLWESVPKPAEAGPEPECGRVT